MNVRVKGVFYSFPVFSWLFYSWIKRFPKWFYVWLLVRCLKLGPVKFTAIRRMNIIYLPPDWTLGHWMATKTPLIWLGCKWWVGGMESSYPSSGCYVPVWWSRRCYLCNGCRALHPSLRGTHSHHLSYSDIMSSVEVVYLSGSSFTLSYLNPTMLSTL